MLRSLRGFSVQAQVVRMVSVCLAAFGVLAYTMAVKGWHVASALAAAGVVVIAAWMIAGLWQTVDHLHRQSSGARQAAAEAEKHYIRVLRHIMKLIEAHERHAEGHSERVAQIAVQIGSKLGLSRSECDMLGLAGELHDIGLLAIPQGILSKHSHLGVEEFRTIQSHSQVSYDILKPLESLKEALPAIRYHHERMNGTGYPAGLSGEQIPLTARIIAVADAYDAMTHDRPYRAAMTPMAALRELRRCSGHGYDPGCIQALGEVLHAPQLEKTLVSVGSDDAL